MLYPATVELWNLDLQVWQDGKQYSGSRKYAEQRLRGIELGRRVQMHIDSPELLPPACPDWCVVDHSRLGHTPPMRTCQSACFGSAHGSRPWIFWTWARDEGWGGSPMIAWTGDVEMDARGARSIAWSINRETADSLLAAGLREAADVLDRITAESS
jgi:hypothetical protein